MVQYWTSYLTCILIWDIIVFHETLPVFLQNFFILFFNCLPLLRTMYLKAELCVSFAFNFSWSHNFLWNDSSWTETLLFEIFLLYFKKFFYYFLFMIELTAFLLSWALLSLVFQLNLYHFELICVVDALIHIQLLNLFEYAIFFFYLNFLLINLKLLLH